MLNTINTIPISPIVPIKKPAKDCLDWLVGVTGFEPATTRPPDVYSNRTELRPVFLRVQKYSLFFYLPNYGIVFAFANNSEVI